jgi:hypothetical protein
MELSWINEKWAYCKHNQRQIAHCYRPISSPEETQMLALCGYSSSIKYLEFLKPARMVCRKCEKVIRGRQKKMKKSAGLATIKPRNYRIDYVKFQKDLEDIINRNCVENGSNTPDFMLAEYMVNCLKAYTKTSRAREKWYGKSLSINMK